MVKIFQRATTDLMEASPPPQPQTADQRCPTTLLPPIFLIIERELPYSDKNKITRKSNNVLPFLFLITYFKLI